MPHRKVWVFRYIQRPCLGAALVAALGAYILLAACATARPVDSAGTRVEPETGVARLAADGYRVSIGLEGITKAPGGLRVVCGFRNDYFLLAPITVAAVRDPYSGRIRVSGNPLLLVPLTILDLLSPDSNSYRRRYPWEAAVWGMFMLALMNSTFQYPVVNDHLYVDAAMRNDFFFFNHPSNGVNSEVSLGLRLRLGNFEAGACALLPLSDVNSGNKEPYLGINSFYVFR